MYNQGLQIGVLEGAASGRVYPLQAPTVSVGRSSPGLASTPDFVHVEDDTVSRLHLELRWDESNQGFTLINRSVTNPTTVNNVLVDEVSVRVGDKVRMGECVWQLQAVGAAPAVGAETVKMKRPIALTSRPSLRLSVLTGPLAGQSIPITGLTAALGGPPDPEEPPLPAKDRWFDQDIVLGPESLPPRCLSLAWKELVNGFELSIRGQDPGVRVLRHKGDLDWQATLPASGAIVRPDDLILVGDIQFGVLIG